MLRGVRRGWSARASAVVLVAAGVLTTSGTASGATTEVQAEAALPAIAQGYFSATGQPTPPDGLPAAPPDVLAGLDGVAPGKLAVGGTGGDEQKASFLLFDAFALPPGATVDAAVLTLPLATGEGNTQTDPAPQKVRACRSGAEGFAGEDGRPLDSAPQRLCDQFEVVGAASGEGLSYSFDLTPLVRTWVAEANDGVALTAVEDPAAGSFQVVFEDMSQAVLAVTFTEPASDTSGSPVDPVVDSGSAPLPSLSFDVPLSTGSDLGFASSPDVAPLDGAVAAPEAAAPQVADAPAVAVTAAAATVVPGAPPLAFWLVAVLLFAGLGGLSLVLGDPTTAAPAAARTSRLSRALAAPGAGARLSRPSATEEPRP